LYAVLTLDYGEVGKLVKIRIFHWISANFRVLVDILADIATHKKARLSDLLYLYNITELTRLDVGNLPTLMGNALTLPKWRVYGEVSLLEGHPGRRNNTEWPIVKFPDFEVSTS